MHRRKKMVWMLLLALMMAGCSKETNQLPLEPVDVSSVPEEESETKDSIFVFVCGAVKLEGVYELPSGSRVFEAIQAAGGFSEDAAVSRINQAEVLQDETRLYVPTINEIEEERFQEETDGKVNINTASKEELMSLPGVGQAKAELIIQYREEHGRFQTIEDIMNISGIKDGLFGKIKDHIKV